MFADTATGREHCKNVTAVRARRPRHSVPPVTCSTSSTWTAGPGARRRGSIRPATGPWIAQFNRW